MLRRKHVVSRSFIMIISKVVLCLLVTTVGEVASQNTENDVHIVETQTANVIVNDTNQNATTTNKPTEAKPTTDPKTEVIEAEPNFIIKVYNTIVKAFKDFFASQKVIAVMKSVGTCIVNGAMEIVTYYVPAPMIPLIASAAGMIIPFEPVVTLREKMPVTSYRRAFNKAVNSFMGTFDKYKDTEVDDPYMTKRFNRRFLNDSPEKKKERYSE